MRQENKDTGHVSPNEVMQLHGRIPQQANDEATNISCTKLEHVNEDCLRKVSSVLTLMDLCSLAETCTHFQQIIGRLFPKDLIIRISSCISYPWAYRFTSRNYSYSRRHEQNDAERILNNFGSILTEIEICIFNQCGSEPLNCALNLVANYCVESLRSLKIGGSNYKIGLRILEEVTVNLKPIFKRLHTLSLTDVAIVYDWTLFSDFDSLTELSVVYVRNCSVLLDNTFPNLERFFCQGYLFPDHDKDQMSAFISRHPRLRTLHLSRAYCNLQIFDNSCKNLEELAIGLEFRNQFFLRPLQALPSLKMLKLSGAKRANFDLNAVMTQLRELHLNCCEKPDVIGQFAFLNQLTKLHIKRMYGIGASDVVEIIKHLENLEEFSVDESLDEQTFSRIVDVVKRRPDVLTLKCFFDFNWKNCDDDDNEKVKLLSYKG